MLMARQSGLPPVLNHLFLKWMSEGFCCQVPSDPA